MYKKRRQQDSKENAGVVEVDLRAESTEEETNETGTEENDFVPTTAKTETEARESEKDGESEDDSENESESESEEELV